MISAWAMSFVVSTQGAPGTVDGASSPDDQAITPAVIRRCDQGTIDQIRKQAWMAYCRELDRAWAEYRAAGSTTAAMDKYKKAAAHAKSRYIDQDPHFAPILP